MAWRESSAPAREDGEGAWTAFVASTRERNATEKRAADGTVAVLDFDDAPAGEVAAAAGGPLGQHEELSHPDALRCVCGPEHLRLLSEHGELVKVRGRSVNRCEYCARLAAVENCEMLVLDALEGDPPAVLIVLGTRTSTVVMSGFYDGLRLVKRALKRRWPAAEYAGLLEFTTGYGPRSGGKRRPHWNLMFKGIPASDADAAGEVAARIWCRHVDAEEHAQHASAIRDGEGLMKYLAEHFNKTSQAPPAGFKGQRFNCSRGYFTGCSRATARARAAESLRLKREVWRASRATDLAGAKLNGSAHDVELAAQLAYRLAIATRWVLATDSGVQCDRNAFLPPALRDDGSRVPRDMMERRRAATVRAEIRRQAARERVADLCSIERAGVLWPPGADDRYA
jgi:hypothetical protein